MTAVVKTSFKIDLPRLLKDVQLVIQKYPLSESVRQLCLTSHKSIDQSVYDGVGSLYDFEKSVFWAEEKDFKYFIKEFQGTYFEEIYHDLQKMSENKIARMRLMFLPPRACYSFHYDKTKRYHVCLMTNGGSFLLFKNEAPIHIPPDGYVYEVDTRDWHTAVNCGHNPRIHLVLSLANDSDDDRLFNEKTPVF